MIYEYLCGGKCKKVITVEKRMTDPSPEKCPVCNSKKFERYFSPESAPVIMNAGRPIWTYNDVKKYKTFRQNGGPLQKVDPTKHGDMGAQYTDAELAPEPKKKRKGKKK